MNLTTFKIEKPAAVNFILGQTHFIKSVEDIRNRAAPRSAGRIADASGYKT